jgi:hypothetical protein
VTAVGVRLCEAPGFPTRGEVHIRIPSDQPRNMRWRVALGDIHLSGDIRSTRLAHHPDRSCLRQPAVSGRVRDFAECTMTGLADQGGAEGSSRMALSGKRSLAGDLIPWKDPL